VANKPQRKVNNRKTNKKGNPLTKRILSGIICLLSCLIILSLTVGYISIKDDLDNLKASGNIISWFKEGNSTTNNPVGIFWHCLRLYFYLSFRLLVFFNRFYYYSYCSVALFFNSGIVKT